MSDKSRSATKGRGVKKSHFGLLHVCGCASPTTIYMAGCYKKEFSYKFFRTLTRQGPRCKTTIGYPSRQSVSLSTIVYSRKSKRIGKFTNNLFAHRPKEINFLASKKCERYYLVWCRVCVCAYICTRRCSERHFRTRSMRGCAITSRMVIIMEWDGMRWWENVRQRTDHLNKKMKKNVK